MSVASTKPYLLRAIYEWCMDHGFTPYLAVVVVDEATRVPLQYVKDGQIVLNLGPEAVHQLVMGNELITCAARFGGVAQSLSVPVDNVSAIYARENGHGMAFEVAEPASGATAAVDEARQVPAAADDSSTDDKSAGPSRPHLTRIK